MSERERERERERVRMKPSYVVLNPAVVVKKKKQPQKRAIETGDSVFRVGTSRR